MNYYAPEHAKIVETSYIIEKTRNLSKEEARKHILNVREEDLGYFFHESLPKMPSIAVMEIILECPFEDVIYDAAANKRTDESVLKLMHEKRPRDSFLQTLLAQNPNTPRETLQLLFRGSDVNTIAALALNPNLTLDDLWVLARTKTAQAGSALLHNPLITSGMIEFLAVRTETPGMQMQIAKHPQSSNEVLKHLIVNAYDDSVVLKALLNLNLNVAEIVRFAADPDSPIVSSDEYIRSLCTYVLQKDRKDEFEQYAKRVLGLGDDDLPIAWYIKMLPTIFYADSSSTVSVWS